MDLDLPNLIKMGTPRLTGVLAKQLIESAPGDLDTVFFTNSGAEGVETAVKPQGARSAVASVTERS